MYNLYFMSEKFTKFTLLHCFFIFNYLLFGHKGCYTKIDK